MKSHAKFAIVAGAPTLLVLAGGAVTASTRPSSPPVVSAGDSLPSGFVQLVDDTGVITVGVPAAWSDVETAPIRLPSSLSANIVASPDLDEFVTGWEAPGIALVAVPYADPQAHVDTFGIADGCESFDTEPFESERLTGLRYTGTGCGEAATATWTLVAANDADQTYSLVLVVQVVSAPDMEAYDVALDTFGTTPEATAFPGSSVPGSSTPASAPPIDTPSTS